MIKGDTKCKYLQHVNFYELIPLLCVLRVSSENIYNNGHIILLRFDALPNFPFTKSETRRDY